LGLGLVGWGFLKGFHDLSKQFLPGYDGVVLIFRGYRFGEFAFLSIEAHIKEALDIVQLQLTYFSISLAQPTHYFLSFSQPIL
jgi:hypothetical protein